MGRARKFSGVTYLEEGLWGIGRVDEFPTAAAFAHAYNDESGLQGYERVDVSEVRRGWGRWMPGFGGYDRYFKLEDGPKRGAFEVWYVEE